MVHRAILGSVERFIAILTEHLAGKWPLWLSPRQVAVLPVSEKSTAYCKEVTDELKRRGFAVELDLQQFTLNKKVKNSVSKSFNYIVVAGEQEAQDGLIDIRTREGERVGKFTVQDFVDKMLAEYPDSVKKP